MRPRGGTFGSNNKGWAFPLGQGGGGTDFETRNWTVNTSTTTHRANTLVDISGSGILVSAYLQNGTGIMAIQVDGGTIYRFEEGSGTNATGIPLLVPFATSLKVTIATATGWEGVHYDLD